MLCVEELESRCVLNAPMAPTTELAEAPVYLAALPLSGMADWGQELYWLAPAQSGEMVLGHNTVSMTGGQLIFHPNLDGITSWGIDAGPGSLTIYVTANGSLMQTESHDYGWTWEPWEQVAQLVAQSPSAPSPEVPPFWWVADMTTGGGPMGGPPPAPVALQVYGTILAQADGIRVGFMENGVVYSGLWDGGWSTEAVDAFFQEPDLWADEVELWNPVG